MFIKSVRAYRSVSSTSYYDWDIRAAAQTNVAWMKRLMEQIREFGCQRKHRKRLSYSGNELLESKTVNRESKDEKDALESKRDGVLRSLE